MIFAALAAVVGPILGDVRQRLEIEKEQLVLSFLGKDANEYHPSPSSCCGYRLHHERGHQLLERCLN